MKLSKDQRTLVTHMIEELKHPLKTLTAWEEKFRLTVALQWGAKHWISEKQFQTLEKLYAEKTS